MLNVMCLPELPVEGPGAAQFDGYGRPRRRLVSCGAMVGNRPWSGALEDISCGRAAHQRLPENKPHRRFHYFLQLLGSVIALRLVGAPRLLCYLRVGDVPRRRDVAGGILGPVSSVQLGMDGVGKIINLLGLPWPQPFAVVADVGSVPRRRHLLRKYQGVAGQVKRLRCQYAGRLMIG